MKTLYIECNMGAAGDMLLAALTELMPGKEDFIAFLNGIGIPKVSYKYGRSEKCGITGARVEVIADGAVEDENMHSHHHHHTGLCGVNHIIDNLNISENVKKNARAVYKLIADAESAAHGRPIKEIHFHEVGTLDAIADIVGVCAAIEKLSPDRIIASAINVGSGTVKCAHGILPVPAPATANILKGIPCYGSGIQSELCTPTGAALLRHFVSEFCVMPAMCVLSIGYGMGKKDFDTANCVRMMLGENENNADKITELCCNIDDMTGEAAGFAISQLLSAGALDVYTAPIHMKKNRPGIILSCMCRERDKDKMLGLIFKHTTTLGVREYICNRYILNREETEVNTDYGKVRAKKAYGWGVSRIKPEYDDMAKLAEEQNISISDIHFSE